MVSRQCEWKVRLEQAEYKGSVGIDVFDLIVTQHVFEHIFLIFRN